MTHNQELFDAADLHVAASDVKTVRDAIRLYETVSMPARNLARRTRVEYSRDLEELARYLDRISIRAIGAVSLQALQEFQAWMDRQSFESSTRRRKTQTIKGFIRFLHRFGVLNQDVAQRLIPPRLRAKEPRYLSESEYKELLRVVQHQPRNAAIVELFLQTGLRLAELARLTVSEVELPARPTPEPDNVGFATVTRKGGRRDTIPLNYKACKALKTWLALRPAVGHDALFVSKLRMPLSLRAIQAMISDALDQAKISGASVHTLRHTMATHHVARGTDLRTVQETLGHADLRTTAGYVQVAKRVQRRALQEHAL